MLKRFRWVLALVFVSGGAVFSGFAQPNYATPFSFSTFAGKAGYAGTNDGTGGGARFDDPAGVAVDTNGNVFVADSYNDTIRKITPSGVVSTVAGSPGNDGFQDGTGQGALFSNPSGVTVDSLGNIYVADTGNNAVRKITPGGAVSTINFTFNSPEGVAAGANGSVYVSDTGNHVIRMVSASGAVSLVAGRSGVNGSADGTGGAARFDVPTGLATDQAGNIYVADSYNDMIRKIAPGGVVTTIAGNPDYYGYDDGLGTNALFDNPTGVAVDGAGNVYVADQDNSTIRLITPNGTVTTVGGVPGDNDFANGVGSSALFSYASGVAVDTSSNLYVADFYNDVIRKGVGSVAPNLTPYQPSGWSDKIVVSRDPNSTVDSTDLTASDSLYVSFAVINDGNAIASGKFDTYLYVDGVYTYDSYYSNLRPTYYTFATNISIGTLSAGTHTLKIVADPLGVIPESDETDNTYTKTIVVGIAGLPDLAPYTPDGWQDSLVVTRDPNGTSNSVGLTVKDSLYVSWAVDNEGTADVTNLFYTQLYLDGTPYDYWYTDPPLTASDYVDVIGESLGNLSAGQHTVEIFADSTDVVSELDKQNNIYSVTFTVTTTAPPAYGPPHVTLTSPTNSAAFVAPVNITNFVTATDTNTGGSIKGVGFFVNGTNLVGYSSTAPFTFIWTNATAGTNLISAVATNNFGLTATSAAVTVYVTPGAAVFTLGSNSYTVLESNGPVLISIQKNANTLGGTVNYSTVDGSAIAASQGVGNYQGISGSLVFAPGDTSKTISVQIANNTVYEGNTTFSFVLSPSGDGSIVGQPGSATVTIIDVNPPATGGSVLIHKNPAQPPPSGGQLQVITQPDSAQGQWRLIWERVWHNSGDVITGLPSGNYPVEFSPVAGFAQPGDSTNAVISGSLTTVTNQYSVTGAASYGSLSVTLYPASLPGGAWQLQGESVWHPSGYVLTNLVAGSHVVEFENVSGWSSPAPLIASVGANQSNTVAATYLLEQQFTATPPSVLQYNSVIIESFGLPYVYNGQLVTDAGYGSGCVVQPRVVLTAGHMIFDDVTLSFVNNVYWFFQEYSGTYNPPAQIPAGAYILDGYAAARTNDLASGGNPGTEPPASQDLDVAALFFLTDAGAGGDSGYLVSDTNVEWLQVTALKTLVGYPMDDVSTVNMGRMHATSPANLSFTGVASNVFTTQDIVGYPGMSGGPLCIQTNGTYYPAGVYLGGTANSIVRAIDAQVAGLITNANVSASTGVNHGGNGGVPVALGSGLTLSSGSYRMQIGPPAALAAGAGWQVVGQGLSTFYTNTAVAYTLPAGTYTITFRPVAGFTTPPNLTVKVVGNQTAGLSVTYGSGGPTIGSFSIVGSNFQLSTGGTAGKSIALERSTDLVHWTGVATNTVPANGTLTFTDAIPLTHPGGTFYRTRLLP
jgi:hypothetical protein